MDFSARQIKAAFNAFHKLRLQCKDVTGALWAAPSLVRISFKSHFDFSEQ